METRILLEENNCPICLESMDTDFITVHCCNKQFHTCCFVNCINLKKECPMCRNEFHEIKISESITQQHQQIISVSRSQLTCAVFCSSSVVGLFLVFIYIIGSK
jgi:hypothetical protein